MQYFIQKVYGFSGKRAERFQHGWLPVYPSRGGAVYFLCFAQGLLQPAGSYLPDVFGDRVQPAHKEMELFLRYIRGLLF